jgi:predicted HicB family RNase H-like nuclease
MPTYPVSLDTELHKKVKTTAASESKSMNEWIIEAIEEKLKEHKNVKV